MFKNSSKYTKVLFVVLVLFAEAIFAQTAIKTNNSHVLNVKIEDGFWGPKIQTWRSKTINDVFDKFEGKYKLEWRLGEEYERTKKRRDAFENFDLVAQGKRDIGKHNGPPWYDGLVYETIRATGDFLKNYEDKALENRVDGYIKRIAAAQQSDSDGFLNTYTQLIESDHRWGRDGGFLRWQHDVYNAGMLIEAGVHYYKGTGKTQLLEVAVKMANLMNDLMGPAPKLNIIPAHAGPEEALVDLYTLFRDHPDVKSKIETAVNKQDYYDLVTFWIEGRGDHVGLPDWNAWGNGKSDQWIRDNKYDDPKFGDHNRPTFGDYAQDSIPVLEQETIEGHAVRATLLATGVTALAMENDDKRYINTAERLWDNMVGKRMSINGGVGTIAFDEKFGPDYFLPNDAYLETCAAVGAGFFSEKMHELTKEGKYIDAFERVLYNNVLSGISLDGDRYTYENPLVSEHHHRWDWHDCPCCPPMFLKMVSALPDFIYSAAAKKIYVNLFVQSNADIQLEEAGEIAIKQTTEYPWNGMIKLEVNPEKPEKFVLAIRIPEWARGEENPYGLYESDFVGGYTVRVNDKTVKTAIVDGYISLQRKWKKGDTVTLDLPMQPRWVTANEKVQDLKGMAVLASGPVIYGFEENTNTDLESLKIDPNVVLDLSFDKDALGGVNIITGEAKQAGEISTFTAVPYFAMGNAQPGNAYKVWVPVED